MPLELTQEPPYYEIVTGPAPTPGVLYYTALINQTGTNAPVPTILTNTLSAAIVWTRDSPGFYIGTLTGAFTLNKTWAIAASNPGNTTFCGVNRIDANTIGIEIATTTDGIYDDSLLVNTPIEIRVYP